MLAKRDGDSVHPDIVAGIPDSGVALRSDMPTSQDFPMQDRLLNIHLHGRDHLCPTNQSQRDLIARMKLIPVQALIENKRLLLIDDSIVRGTQLRETTESCTGAVQRRFTCVRRARLWCMAADI